MRFTQQVLTRPETSTMASRFWVASTMFSARVMFSPVSSLSFSMMRKMYFCGALNPVPMAVRRG